MSAKQFVNGTFEGSTDKLIDEYSNFKVKSDDATIKDTSNPNADYENHPDVNFEYCSTESVQYTNVGNIGMMLSSNSKIVGDVNSTNNNSGYCESLNDDIEYSNCDTYGDNADVNGCNKEYVNVDDVEPLDEYHNC
eukprot:Pgem_evm1s3212